MKKEKVMRIQITVACRRVIWAGWSVQKSSKHILTSCESYSVFGANQKLDHLNIGCMHFYFQSYQWL